MYCTSPLYITCIVWTCKHNTMTQTSIFSLYSVTSLMQLALQPFQAFEALQLRIPFFWDVAFIYWVFVYQCGAQHLRRTEFSNRLYLKGTVRAVTNYALYLKQYEIYNKYACYEPVSSRLTYRKESGVHKNRQCVCVCVCVCVYAHARPVWIFVEFLSVSSFCRTEHYLK
jgi:hypothetical protein